MITARYQCQVVMLDNMKPCRRRPGKEKRMGTRVAATGKRTLFLGVQTWALCQPRC